MFEEEGSSILPWDPFWEFLLGDRELDAASLRGDAEGQDAQKEAAPLPDSEHRRAEVKKSNGQSKRKLWNRKWRNNGYERLRSQSGRSIASEKTTQQRNSRLDQRDDQWWRKRSQSDDGTQTDENTDIQAEIREDTRTEASDIHAMNLRQPGGSESIATSITGEHGTAEGESHQGRPGESGMDPEPSRSLVDWIERWGEESSSEGTSLEGSLEGTSVGRDALTLQSLDNSALTTEIQTIVGGDDESTHLSGISFLDEKSRDGEREIRLQHRPQRARSTQSSLMDSRLESDQEATVETRGEEDDEEDATEGFRRLLHNTYDQTQSTTNPLFEERFQHMINADFSLSQESASASAPPSDGMQQNLVHPRETYPMNLGRKVAPSSLITMDDNPNAALQQNRGLASHRIACCSIKSLSDIDRLISETTGIPVQELSAEELDRIFPKLLTVVDNRPELIGRTGEFDSTIPAHLQTSLIMLGKPQSLYEYEYESTDPLSVVYASFGPDPRTLLSLQSVNVDITAAEHGTCNVLVKVEASTVSHTDCFIRQGYWWRSDPIPLPNTPGVDAVGKVSLIDEKSSKRYNISLGDRVMTLTRNGGNARYLGVNPSRLVKISEHVDPAMATCLAETYLSAYQILFHGVRGGKRQRRGALKGRTYLIFGPMDPKFGSALSEISKFAGIKHLYASATKKRFKLLETQGIIPLDRDADDWKSRMKDQVDCIISFEQECLPAHFSLLKKGGEIILVCCGDIRIEDDTRKRPLVFCSKLKSQQSGRTHMYDVYKEWDERNEQCKKDLAFLIQLLEKEVVQPYVLDRIPLKKVARAQEMLERKRLSGYIVCQPWLVTKSRAIRL